ncbi:MAG: hypothetical protein NVS3B7_08960 [Candidatus Elarobacter sp.]
MRYLLTAAVTFGLILGGYVALEVTVDEFGVFKAAPQTKTVCVPNARAMKIRYLAGDRRPEAFVLGSSRANYYRVATLERLSGKAAYNLSSPMENALGMQRWAHWLVRNRDPREVVLALDFDLLELPYDPADPFVRDPPELTGESRFAFALHYALTPPDQLAACLRARWRGSPYRFEPTTGEDFSRTARPLDRPPYRIHAFAARRVDPSAGRLASMIAVLRARGAHVTVIINPVWSGRFRLYRPIVYERWLRNVVLVSGGVWDFSGINPVTNRIGNYYDDVHFTENVGNLVLETVYGRGGAAKFGVFVDARTVDDRIAEIHRELLATASPHALGS